MEMERIELELQKQLHGFADEMSAKFPKTPKQVIETKVNHAIHSAAKFVATQKNKKQKTTTKVQMVKPEPSSSASYDDVGGSTTSQYDEECRLPPDVSRARDCASNIGECSLEELEMLDKGTCLIFSIFFGYGAILNRVKQRVKIFGMESSFLYSVPFIFIFIYFLTPSQHNFFFQKFYFLLDTK